MRTKFFVLVLFVAFGLTANAQVVNNVEKELVVLKIPANSIFLKSDEKDGLYVRTDKTDLIDLKINVYDFKLG